jgi:hypothetical protein
MVVGGGLHNNTSNHVSVMVNRDSNILQELKNDERFKYFGDGH